MRQREEPVPDEQADSIFHRGQPPLVDRVSAGEQAVRRQQSVLDVRVSEQFEDFPGFQPVQVKPLLVPYPSEKGREQRWQARRQPAHITGKGGETLGRVLRLTSLACALAQLVFDHVAPELRKWQELEQRRRPCSAPAVIAAARDDEGQPDVGIRGLLHGAADLAQRMPQPRGRRIWEPFRAVDEAEHALVLPAHALRDSAICRRFVSHRLLEAEDVSEQFPRIFANFGL